MEIANPNVLEEGNCLTQNQLLDYLAGSLNLIECHKVELHLVSCTLCQDALEGYSFLKDKDKVPLIVQQIQNQLRKELFSHNSKNRKIKFNSWLTALVLIILIIALVAFFSIRFSENYKIEMKKIPNNKERSIFHK